MSRSFYEEGEHRAGKVQQLFARIAPRYDLINDLQSAGLHRLWKRRLVRLARPAPGLKALDVCCGTGDLTLALAAAGAEATGLDFSGEMLEVARKRGVEGEHPPTFIRGDAQALPCPDASFDIVTVAYGLRNLSSWQNGLAEMKRVARPGGRLLVLDFGKPDNPVWRALYFSYLRLFVPVLGLVFCGSARAYSYILESLQHYPAQHGVEAELRRLGLERVQTINLLGGVMSISYAEQKGPAVAGP